MFDVHSNTGSTPCVWVCFCPQRRRSVAASPYDTTLGLEDVALGDGEDREDVEGEHSANTTCGHGLHTFARMNAYDATRRTLGVALGRR